MYVYSKTPDPGMKEQKKALFKVVWIGIVGKMLILPKKIDKWDSPVMFEGLGGK